ncbi:hypothetical protein D3C80_1027500 [compost metagenome]
MATIRPAPKLSSVTSIRSASNRTGTSKTNPAVTTAPKAGAAVSVTTPVAASTMNPAVSTPPTATRTDPSTGFLIRRSWSP